MTFVAAGVGVAGIGASLVSANKNSKAAGNAQQQQLAMQQQNLAFQKMQYEHETALTDPARKQFLSEAMSSTPFGYAQQASQINQNYSEAGVNGNNYNYGSGMANSGLAAARNTSLAMGKASDLAGAYRTGLDKQAGMLQAAAGMGTPQAAANGVSGAYNAAGNVYGQQAAGFNQAALGAYGAGANLIGGLAKYYGSRDAPGRNPNQPQPGSRSGASITPDYGESPAYGQSDWQDGLENPFASSSFGTFLPGDE